jgi:2-hydroxychromene-2-carboxylate isomerase
MPVAIDVYYDFRSRYAYFASHRLRSAAFAALGHVWTWRPVSIDVLLNLQAGRAPWAPYVDPLSAPKRAHLIADVRRLANYQNLPLRAPKPPRPNAVPALCLARLIEGTKRAAFNCAVFDALWQEQQDIGSADVLRACLTRSDVAPDILPAAFEEVARDRLAEDTSEAYARGVFGVPTFVVSDEIFFGSDRIDLLLWSIARRA